MCTRGQRLKQEKIENVHLAFSSNGNVVNNKSKQDTKGKRVVHPGTLKPEVQKKQDNEIASLQKKLDMNKKIVL